MRRAFEEAYNGISSKLFPTLPPQPPSNNTRTNGCFMSYCGPIAGTGGGGGERDCGHNNNNNVRDGEPIPEREEKVNLNVIKDENSDKEEREEIRCFVSELEGLLRDDNVSGDDDDEEEEEEEDDSDEEEMDDCANCANVRHIRQLETWDCGIACVQMVLTWLRDDDNDRPNEGQTNHSPSHNNQCANDVVNTINKQQRERDHMIEYVNTESVWTIDLVVLLESFLKRRRKPANYASGQCHPNTNQQELINHFEINEEENDDDDDNVFHNNIIDANLLFSSKKLGVDQTHNQLDYYHSSFCRDERRVLTRFRHARDVLNVPMIQMSNLTLDWVIHIVDSSLSSKRQRECIAIVLLDNCILQHQKHQHHKSSMCLNEEISLSSSSTLESSSYAGHYVLLCGISRDERHVAKAKIAARQDFQNESYNTKKGRKSMSARFSSGKEFCLVVKNPASVNDVDFVDPLLFERAWKANGTDDDVVFVSKKKNKKRRGIS